jgi:hypothetical protein
MSLLFVRHKQSTQSRMSMSIFQPSIASFPPLRSPHCHFLDLTCALSSRRQSNMRATQADHSRFKAHLVTTHRSDFSMMRLQRDRCSCWCSSECDRSSVKLQLWLPSHCCCPADWHFVDCVPQGMRSVRQRAAMQQCRQQCHRSEQRCRRTNLQPKLESLLATSSMTLSSLLSTPASRMCNWRPQFVEQCY